MILALRDDFGIVFRSFWCRFVLILESFSGRFGAFLTLLWHFFLGLLTPKTDHLGAVWVKKKCIETVKPYFEERVWSYRSVKEPGQTDTDSSRYDPFLVPKRPFYIGIENSFRSYLL